MALPIARDKEADVIQAQSLATTTTAGVVSAIAGIGGAFIALLPRFSELNAPLALQVAGLGVVGLAIIGWGIATAGDALARAYATAHVDSDGNSLMGKVLTDATFGVAGAQNDGSDAKRPALAAAVQRLAEAHENATFGIAGAQNDGSDAKKPALAEAVRQLGALKGAGQALEIIEAPAGLQYVEGQNSFHVAALLVSGDRTVQQLYFDSAGQPRLTEPVEIQQ